MCFCGMHRPGRPSTHASQTTASRVATALHVVALRSVLLFSSIAICIWISACFMMSAKALDVVVADVIHAQVLTSVLKMDLTISRKFRNVDGQAKGTEDTSSHAHTSLQSMMQTTMERWIPHLQQSARAINHYFSSNAWL
eukprot:2511341-Amphidinium_carterae.1